MTLWIGHMSYWKGYYQHNTGQRRAYFLQYSKSVPFQSDVWYSESVNGSTWLCRGSCMHTLHFIYNKTKLFLSDVHFALVPYSRWIQPNTSSDVLGNGLHCKSACVVYCIVWNMTLYWKIFFLIYPAYTENWTVDIFWQFSPPFLNFKWFIQLFLKFTVSPYFCYPRWFWQIASGWCCSIYMNHSSDLGHI